MLLWFGHGCSGYRMHWEHECSCGLRMDAPVIGCTRNTSVIRVWAWMPWLSDALRTRTLLWFLVVIACTENANVIMVFWHGCSGYRMHGCSGYRMHSCTRNTNVMVWAGGLRSSGCFWPTVRYYPHPPPQPPKAKLRTLAKQGTEITPLAFTSNSGFIAGLPSHGF